MLSDFKCTSKCVRTMRYFTLHESKIHKNQLFQKCCESHMLFMLYIVKVLVENDKCSVTLFLKQMFLMIIHSFHVWINLVYDVSCGVCPCKLYILTYVYGLIQETEIPSCINGRLEIYQPGCAQSCK